MKFVRSLSTRQKANTCDLKLLKNRKPFTEKFEVSISLPTHKNSRSHFYKFETLYKFFEFYSICNPSQLMLEATGATNILVNIYETTWCHNPEDHKSNAAFESSKMFL
jgi:hypothetical protein